MASPRKRKAVLVAAAALLCAAVLGGVLAKTIAASSANQAAGFGVYDGAATPPTALNSALSGNVKYVTDFQDGTSWSSIIQSWPYTSWRGTSYSMIWSIPMLPSTYSASSNLSNTSGSCTGLTQEAAGAFNGNWVKIAQAMVANEFGSSIVRPGWEFNGNWFPWSAIGCPGAYVGAYQQIVTAMRSVAGANFAFEWNPNLGDLSAGNVASFYPGNSYVNYVGSDVYDNAGPNYPGAQAEFNTMLTEPYGLNWLASFAAQAGKQIVLPEWGLGWGTCNAGQPISTTGGGGTCGGDNPTFINDMSSWIKSNNVFDTNFWDYGSSSMAGCPNACTPIGRNEDDVNPIAAGNVNSFKALVADFGTGSGSSTTTTTHLSPTTTTTTHPATTTTMHPATTTTTTPPSGINVTHVGPSSGPTLGGTSVTIGGTGFSGATVVDFGSAPATIGAVTATSITATAPPSAAGTVNVTVVSPLGRSPVSALDQFTYVAAKPTVSSVAPSVGVAGTSVTIMGSGFSGATAVRFGSAAASFSVGSNTSIVATAPPGTPTAAVDISVTGPGGSSTAVTADRFTYGPVVSSVTPTSGNHAGGTTVTIKGVGFTGATGVSFSGTPVTSAITVNATGSQITVAAPAHGAGTVDVMVTVGTTTTLATSLDHFTYF